MKSAFTTALIASAAWASSTTAELKQMGTRGIEANLALAQIMASKSPAVHDVELPQLLS